MPRQPRHLPRPGCLAEVTVHTAPSRYLLRPGRALNEIFAGCLGKALELHPVRLHAVVVMSTHYHLLLSPEDSRQLAGFMGHLNTNLSKKIGALHGWKGSLFESRYRCIPVSDEPAAQQARLRYLLRHGCKEGLVWSPRHWPGVHSATALCDGEPIRGTWFRGTDRRRAGDEDRTEYEIRLAPLPCWQHLGEETWRGFVREMVAEIERETKDEHRRSGTRPAGARWVRRRRPHERAKEVARSPPPLVHAASRAVRRAWTEAIRLFVSAYRDASERLRAGEVGASFPPDCFPPGLAYVPPG